MIPLPSSRRHEFLPPVPPLLAVASLWPSLVPAATSFGFPSATSGSADGRPASSALLRRFTCGPAPPPRTASPPLVAVVEPSPRCCRSPAERSFELPSILSSSPTTGRPALALPWRRIEHHHGRRKVEPN